MTCQDVSFAHGRCRIEVESRAEADIPMFAARILVVDGDEPVLRELTFADGRRVEIHGQTEMLALNSAVTYLEGRLGARAGPEFDCDPTAHLKHGPPLDVDEFRLSP
jgi:hypothetical protein